MNAENADKTIKNQRLSAFIRGKNNLIYLRNLDKKPQIRNSGFQRISYKTFPFNTPSA